MNNGEINLLDRLITYQGSIRKWQQHFKPAEFSVLISVLDMAVGFGRTQARLSNGDLVRQTGLADSTVRSALKALCNRGVLIRGHCDGRRTEYTIVTNWMPAEQTTEIPVPETNGLVADDRRTERRKPAVARPLYNTEGKKKGNQEGNSYRAMADELKSLPIPVFKEVWEAEWRKAYPTACCPGWGPREYGIAKGIADRLAQEFYSTTRVKALIEDLIANWSALCASQFGWMKDKPPPAHPELGFIQRFLSMLEGSVAHIQVTRKKAPRRAFDEEGWAVYDTEYYAQFKDGFGEWDGEPVPA